MEWTENIIIADGGYVDSVAFNLTVNFERMIGRRIPPADMARWVECIALDGGMRPGEGEQSKQTQTQVVLVHETGKQRMENFAPGHYADELHGKAFTGRLGEFMFTCINPEGLTTTDALLQDTLQLALQADGVKRIMVVPGEQGLNSVSHTVRRAAGSDKPKQITVFTMEPFAGGHLQQEILGYSLMAALGVKSSELNPEN